MGFFIRIVVAPGLPLLLGMQSVPGVEELKQETPGTFLDAYQKPRVLPVVLETGRPFGPVASVKELNCAAAPMAHTGYVCVPVVKLIEDKVQIVFETASSSSVPVVCS